MAIAASILCWLAGAAFLVLAFRAIHKDKFGLAGTCIFLAAFSLLSGQPWFQGLAKTWIVSNVGARLAALGKQMDDVQTTTGKMQTELSDHQKQLELQQKEINESQGRLRTNQTEIAVQQDAITNHYRAIRDTQIKVSIAQTNLDNQEKRLEDVQFLVENLFSKMATEDFSGSDSNSVTILTFSNGAQQVFFKLKEVPVLNSLQGVQLSPMQMPLVDVGYEENIAFTYFEPASGPGNSKFQFRYVPDSRRTNRYNKVRVEGTKVLMDGHWIHFIQNER